MFCRLVGWLVVQEHKIYVHQEFNIRFIALCIIIIQVNIRFHRRSNQIYVFIIDLLSKLKELCFKGLNVTVNLRATPIFGIFNVYVLCSRQTILIPLSKLKFTVPVKVHAFQQSPTYKTKRSERTKKKIFSL